MANGTYHFLESTLNAADRLLSVEQRDILNINCDDDVAPSVVILIYGAFNSITIQHDLCVFWETILRKSETFNQSQC